MSVVESHRARRPRPCHATCADLRAWTAPSRPRPRRGRRRQPGASGVAHAKYAYWLIEEQSNDNLARLETVPAGGVDGHQAPIEDQLAALAHAWSRDQALAAAAHGRGARGRAWLRLLPEGVLRERDPAGSVLLHNPSVLAPLGPRDYLRDSRPRSLPLQLRQADTIPPRPLPARQQHEHLHRRDSRIPIESPRSPHPHH